MAGAVYALDSALRLAEERYLVLTSQAAPERIDLPHEPGEWIEIRKLSGTQLQHAQAAKRHEGVQNMRELGADIAQAVIAAQRGDSTNGNISKADVDAARAENDADPLAAYDRRTLLLEGIVGWSYKDNTSAKSIPVTPQNIDDLDEETMQFIALALVKRRTDAERGEDSEPSTTPSTAW